MVEILGAVTNYKSPFDMALQCDKFLQIFRYIQELSITLNISFSFHFQESQLHARFMFTCKDVGPILFSLNNYTSQCRSNFR